MRTKTVNVEIIFNEIDSEQDTQTRPSDVYKHEKTGLQIYKVSHYTLVCAAIKTYNGSILNANAL